jgi:hypothetical protein
MEQNLIVSLCEYTSFSDLKINLKKPGSRNSNENVNLVRFQTCRSLNLCESSLWFRCHPERMRLLKTELENQFQDCKICAM